MINRILRIIGLEVNIKRKEKLSNDVLKLEKEFSKNEKIKLHIGCGPRILKGWINIDLNYEPCENYLKYYTDKYYGPEVRGNDSDFYAMDVTKTGLPLPDNSVDVIFHEDFIEHLNQEQQIVFLAETRRVLKKNGIHRVNTPDLIISMRNYSDFSKGFEGVNNKEWQKHGHLNVLSPSLLKEMALMVGYSDVLFNQRDKSISSLIPLEYRPDPKSRSENGNIFADLIK